MQSVEELVRAPRFDRLLGLVVELPHRCRRCESIAAVISPNSKAHLAPLHCQQCDAHRGWLSRSTQAFVTEIVNRFGSPTAPIKIRCSEQAIENSETCPGCAPTASSVSQGDW